MNRLAMLSSLIIIIPLMGMRGLDGEVGIPGFSMLAFQANM